MTLRRFFTISILVILLGITAIGGIYLYTFDLNSFRTEIETLASEQISRPLTLGKAHLSLKHGPAFAFDNVEIGTAADDLYLTVDKVFFRVKTIPLLTGKILFSEILLENPDFSIEQRQSETEGTAFQFKPEQSLRTGELIKSLRVLNGTIRVNASTRDKNTERFVIENLRFNIDDFSFLHAGNIRTKATLLYRGVRSPFSFDGRYYPDKETTSWSNAFYQLKLNIDNLAAKNVSTLLQTTNTDSPLKGFVDLNLQIEGSPEQGVTFKSKLTGHSLNLTSAAIADQPITISNADLTGRIKYLKDAVDLESVKFTLKTGLGQIVSENSVKIGLAGNRLTSVSGRGSLSVKRSSMVVPTEKSIVTSDLTASYQANIGRIKNGWRVTKGQLLLPGIKLGVDGQWHVKDKHSFDLNLNIPEASLTSVTALFPGLNQLRKLDLNGRFEAQLNLAGSGSGPTETSGRLNLLNAHLAIPGQLADLNNLNGTIELENKTIRATGLQTDLGNSPISVDLTIPDLNDPDITLHVLADSIRADELIFSSDKHHLRQVDGIVRIADKTVFLGPIHVKMDGGTDATVNGTVKNFAAADVALDIKGRHGNIDEIIALWAKDHVQPPASPPSAHRAGSLLIDIITDSGQISGMQFDRATSKITKRAETLVIGPIQFKAKAGEGLGQVLIDKQSDGQSRLKISGNLKNFDAQTIYNQLLKRPGLVSGRLSGDFFLEGMAGKQFLPTSAGSFAVQIDKGRLYKLTGLAKILQLLNIYPLLSENVQGKGLPYDAITFNAKLSQGVLTTEDFLLNGDIMNLSLTGQYNIIDNTVDLDLGAMPLRTVDSILSRIPIAGWLLTGSDKALVIAYFKMTGSANDPELTSVPLDSVTTPVIGILKRVFSFPVKIVTDPGQVILNQ